MSKRAVATWALALVIICGGFAADVTQTTASMDTKNSVVAPRTFYIATHGRDGNPGTLDSPWATPNHTVQCGDTILVQPGTYSAAHFDIKMWGHVLNCRQDSWFATIKCNAAYLQACTVTEALGGQSAFAVTASDWAVEGFTVTAPVIYGDCFRAGPPSKTTPLHHIAFINDYAYDCGGGIGAGYTDYLAYIGVIAYHGAWGGGQCYSGLSILEPTAYDHAAGTHIFVAGLFSIDNIDKPHCTDGEGIILDTISANNYLQRIVVEQSMFLGNGSNGIEVYKSSAPTVFSHVTSYGNMMDSALRAGEPSEYVVNEGYNVLLTNSILQSRYQYLGANKSKPIYAIHAGFVDSTDVIQHTDYVGAGRQNYIQYGHNFTFGVGNLNVDPDFVNPTIPSPSSPPDCSEVATTTGCLARVIANFTAQNAGVLAAGQGYQAPGGCRVDAYWPTWIPVRMIPIGLVTHPC